MLQQLFLMCVFLVFPKSDAAPTVEHRMTVSKTTAMDLDMDSSATGYVYNQQQGLPVYYVHYTNHGSGRYYHPDAVQYVFEAAAPVAHSVPGASLLLPYAYDALPSAHQGAADYDNEVKQQLVDSEPRAPYYVGEKMADEHKGKYGTYEAHGDVEGEDSHDENIHGEFDGSVKDSGYDDSYGHGGIGDSWDDGGSSFENGAGEDYESKGYSEHGEKGDKGYDTKEGFSNSDHGSDDSGHDGGYYKNSGGQKKGHDDEAEKHGSYEEWEDGNGGSSYGHSSYHKKGHKTNGFHNVYHKDEYKKETDIYDDDHKKGHFEEYDEFDKGYGTEESGSKKGGHHSSEHDYQDRGKKGHYDRGNHDNRDQGHRAEQGEKSYYDNYENYAEEGGSETDKTHKYSEKDR
ncbi:uncharacterized protein At5g39570-like [Ceratina calcarata]|uniref:Uncharacterized protein At5g39570-like n=1 Tax=Ceratina calcarata TaxID=156304 RepID=A0AAJ7N2X6_9HYME|nr:uncharacterized protein At5g39570-like [Ceratina calcarata]